MTKNKLWKIIISAVIAFGLWIYVVSVVSPGTEKTFYDIEVVIPDKTALEAEGLILTDYDKTVTVRLEGNRTDLNKLNESNLEAYAYVSGITSTGDKTINYTVSLPDSVAGSAIVVQKKSPDQLTVKIEKLMTKQVQVICEPEGTLPDGYSVKEEQVVFSQKEITVSGPENVVSRMEYAVISVDLNERTKSFSGEYEYTLCDENKERVDAEASLIKTNVNTVNMTLPILLYKELPLEVKVNPGGGATADNCEITIGPIDTIKVSGPDAKLKDLEAITIHTIDLADIREDSTLTLPIKLPEGITNESPEYSEVTVQIKLKGLKTKSLPVSQIQVINVPQGMKHDALPSYVTVEVRGAAALVDQLTEQDVTLTLDLTSARAGVNPIVAKVSFSSEFDSLGVLNAPEVTLSLAAQ